MEPSQISHKERLAVIGEYVRERLKKECDGTWGREGELAKRIGFSSAQISNVKDGRRGVGRGLVMALAMHWGLNYEQLERIAFEDWERSRLSREQAAVPIHQTHPNLAATVEYCKGSFPDAYLAEYLRYARHLLRDRPKEVWMQDIQVQYYDWKQRGVLPYEEVSNAEASSIIQQGAAGKAKPADASGSQSKKGHDPSAVHAKHAATAQPPQKKSHAR
jgi:hypothetical protein